MASSSSSSGRFVPNIFEIVNTQTDVDEDDVRFEFYTDFQNRFLQIYFGAAAVPSWLGSALILYVLFREGSWRKDTYHRLWVGLSVCNFWWALSLTVFTGATWSIPEHLASAYVIGASAADHGWCTLRGMFWQLNLGVQNYSVSLLIYFVFRYSLRMRKSLIGRLMEPWMHGLSLTVALAAIVIPAFLGWLNPSARYPGLCVVASFPIQCERAQQRLLQDEEETMECIRGGEPAQAFRTLLVVPLVLSALVLTAAVVLLRRRLTNLQQRPPPVLPLTAIDRFYQRQAPPPRLSSSTTSMAIQQVRRGLRFGLAYALYAVGTLTSLLYQAGYSSDTRDAYFVTAVLFATLSINQGLWHALLFLGPRWHQLTTSSPEATLACFGPLTRACERWCSCLSCLCPCCGNKNGTTNQQQQQPPCASNCYDYFYYYCWDPCLACWERRQQHSRASKSGKESVGELGSSIPSNDEYDEPPSVALLYHTMTRNKLHQDLHNDRKPDNAQSPSPLTVLENNEDDDDDDKDHAEPDTPTTPNTRTNPSPAVATVFANVEPESSPEHHVPESHCPDSSVSSQETPPKPPLPLPEFPEEEIPPVSHSSSRLRSQPSEESLAEEETATPEARVVRPSNHIKIRSVAVRSSSSGSINRSNMSTAVHQLRRMMNDVVRTDDTTTTATTTTNDNNDNNNDSINKDSSSSNSSSTKRSGSYTESPDNGKSKKRRKSGQPRNIFADANKVYTADDGVVWERHSMPLPGGRLGIVIESGVDSPVVQHVYWDSPLRGRLQVGDRIVSMGPVDTRQMTGQQLLTFLTSAVGVKMRRFVVERRRTEEETIEFSTMPFSTSFGDLSVSEVDATSVDQAIIVRERLHAHAASSLVGDDDDNDDNGNDHIAAILRTASSESGEFTEFSHGNELIPTVVDDYV